MVKVSRSVSIVIYMSILFHTLHHPADRDCIYQELRVQADAGLIFVIGR